MTDLEYMQESDKLFHRYSVEYFVKNGGKPRCTNHIHMCDFEIISRLEPWRKRHKKDWAKYQCKKYLKQYGKKRDECLNCCDECPHSRYIEYNDDFFIHTLITNGVSYGRNNPWLNKDMIDGIDRSNYGLEK